MYLPDFIPTPINWAAWELLIEAQGITIDRPFASAHPDHPSIIYPIDYGFINGTISTDGAELDIFCGSSTNKLVALIQTADFRKGDREIKMIYNCTPAEIYLVNGFINYDPNLMQGRLMMRYPMKEIWGSGFRVSGSEFGSHSTNKQPETRNPKPGTQSF